MGGPGGVGGSGGSVAGGGAGGVGGSGTAGYQGGGLSPNFLFLQLYHSQCVGGREEDRPVPIPVNDVSKRSIFQSMM